MQAEVATWPDSGLGNVPVVGMNAITAGDSAWVAAMCATVTTLPLLQDADSVSVWVRAGAEKDDVFILDSQHRLARKFSCLDHPLNEPANADSLRAWVRQVAGVGIISP